VVSATGSRASVADPPASGAEAHRRERKKRQTRDALVHAALKLFNAKGYEHTAVREITDAVDVSERTFFRYFASKEDLAMSFVRDASDALIRELAARPPEEEPLLALRNAFRASLRAVAAAESHPGEEPVYLLVVKLIDATPSLLAAHLRYLHDRDDELVRVLAAREGVEYAADLRPRIAAVVFGGLVATATKQWRTGGSGTVDEMLAAVDACLDQVGPALAGHWTAR
jgi:AcrR family transcriptional regulator